MIYLKIILAILLTAAAMLIKKAVNEKEETDSRTKSLPALLSPLLPYVRKGWLKAVKFLRRLSEGMRRLDSFRKFFTLVLLLSIIAIQFIDFSASSSVAQMLSEELHQGAATLDEGMVKTYTPLMTYPQTTMVSGLLAMMFFSYKLSDKILLLLKKRKVFFWTCITTILVLLSSPRNMVLAETLMMIEMSSLFYPFKVPDATPKNRVPLPSREELAMIRMAA